MQVHYPLATTTWDDAEKNAAKEVIDSGFCTMGKRVYEFESEFAKKFGTKYAVMSNSGSSANLLMLSAYRYANFGKDAAIEDLEIIVPAVSWSTTYYPISQMGFKLVFVDIDLETLNMDQSKVASAITRNTVAILAVNLLGVPCKYDKLLELCNQYGLTLLIDNCESMGATYNNVECGTLGLMGTYSTFFSHHLCTIEGGMTVTNDEKLYHYLISLRAHGWVRGLPSKNHVYDNVGDPFVDLFRFVLPGYNVRPNEVFAAIGLEQIKKLDLFLHDRRANRKYFEEAICKYPSVRNNVIIQQAPANTNPSWFGFSIILTGKMKDKRKQVAQVLKDCGIECRPIVAGNFTKNPVINHLHYSIPDRLPNADRIDNDGLFVGNNPGDLSKSIDLFVDILAKCCL